MTQSSISTSALLTAQLILLLTACGPSPNQTPSATPSATPTPSPSASVPLSSPPLIPHTSPPPSGSGVTPTPAPTDNPAAGTSTTVNLPNGTKLVLTLANRFLDAKGQTVQVQAQLLDANGKELPLGDLKLAYSSSRPVDFSVDDQGLITALTDSGFSTITVEVVGMGLQASQVISVNTIDTYLSSGGGGGGGSSSSATPSENVNLSGQFEGLGLGEFQVNSYTTHQQDYPSVAMDTTGNFVVVWDSYTQDGSRYGSYGQRYNSAGVPQGSEFQINTYTTNDQQFSAVAMDASGNFVTSWSDSAHHNVYAQLYNNQGQAQ